MCNIFASSRTRRAAGNHRNRPDYEVLDVCEIFSARLGGTLCLNLASNSIAPKKKTKCPIYLINLFPMQYSNRKLLGYIQQRHIISKHTRRHFLRQCALCSRQTPAHHRVPINHNYQHTFPRHHFRQQKDPEYTPVLDSGPLFVHLSLFHPSVPRNLGKIRME